MGGALAQDRGLGEDGGGGALRMWTVVKAAGWPRGWYVAQGGAEDRTPRSSRRQVHSSQRTRKLPEGSGQQGLEVKAHKEATEFCQATEGRKPWGYRVLLERTVLSLP